MGLHRRGRIWHIDFYAGAKRIQESSRTANKKEAERILALRISEVQRGVFVKTVHLPLQQLWERYFGHAKTHKRSWKRDEQMYTNLSSFFGSVNLDAITAERVEAFQESRRQEVAPATVNRECALLKHMFNMADRWDMYQGRNPVRLVKFLEEDNLQFQTLSQEEERALLACCPSYLQDMIVFALNTGLRCGDIFKLAWEEADLEEKRLVFLVQKTHKLLSLPLNDSAYGVLQAWQAIRKCQYVFYNQMTGDRFRDVKNGFKQACRDAKIKSVTWHTFRHTFATRLLRDGVDIVTVKELMGHSTVLVTMRYAHTNEGAKIEAVHKITGCVRPVTVIPKPRRNKQ